MMEKGLMRVSEIILYIVIIGIFLLPVVLIVMDIRYFIKKKEKPVFELIAFSTGAVYTGFATVVWDLPDYKHPINIYASTHAHEPFSNEYFGIIVFVAIVGFFCYFVLKFKKDFPPLVKAFLLSGVYICCAYNALWLIQLLCGARPRQSSEYSNHILKLNGSDYFIIFCLCIVPVMYFFHCGQLLYTIVRDSAKEQEKKLYENPVLNRINTFFLNGTNLLLAGFVIVLPVLVIVVVILCFFGQQPDSMLYTFTKTSDWILSKEIAPPPVAHDMHYLCTVSLRGHKRLVKPLRYGIRKGEKIVVNRQLCVANAFEELIMEKTPRFHKALRHFYDTYGYPISKHINNAWSADIVYLIMKPLELFFVGVLYCFDIRPEDRICRQYLPKDELEGLFKIR